MKKTLTGAAASGIAHPEIRKGDTWKDKRGGTVTVKNAGFNRVTFIREGYSGDCILPVLRFESEFTLVKRQTFSEWCKANNTAEKIQNLCALINTCRESKP